MRIGLNTFALHSLFTGEQLPCLALIKDWGFDSVEMAIEFPERIDAREARQCVADSGLASPVVCGVFGPGRDLRGSLAHQEAATDYLQRLIEWSAIVGADTVAGPCYSSVGRAELYTPDERCRQREQVIHHLQRIAEFAASAGIRLALEPLNRYETDFLNTSAQGLELLAQINCPNVGLHLDTFHMNIEESSWVEAIRLTGDRLFHFHASANHRGIIGLDTLPWANLASELACVGYRGDIGIESFRPDMPTLAAACRLWRPLYPSPEIFARESLAHLRRHFSAPFPSRYPSSSSAP